MKFYKMLKWCCGFYCFELLDKLGSYNYLLNEFQISNSLLNLGQSAKGDLILSILLDLRDPILE